MEACEGLSFFDTLAASLGLGYPDDEGGDGGAPEGWSIRERVPFGFGPFDAPAMRAQLAGEAAPANSPFGAGVGPLLEEVATGGDLDTEVAARSEVPQGPEAAAQPAGQRPSTRPNGRRGDKSLDNTVDFSALNERLHWIASGREALVEDFVSRARQLIASWEADRLDPELRFSNREAMAGLWSEADLRWRGELDGRGDFGGSDLGQEIRNRLDSGTFRHSLREILSFPHSRAGLEAYGRLFDIPLDQRQHHYELRTWGGFSLGALLKGSLKGFEIRYHNPLGMQWTRFMACGGVGAGLGLQVNWGGPARAAADLDAPDAHEDLTGATSSFNYFAPSFFEVAQVGWADLFLGLIMGTTAGSITFSQGMRELQFTSSGSSTGAGAGVSSQVGICHGSGVDFSVPDLEDAPALEAWQPLIEAHVYFPTNVSSLGPDDQATLERVLAGMIAIERHQPGSEFLVELTGSASRLGSARRNAELAHERVSRVEGAMMRMLAAIPGMQAEFATFFEHVDGSEFHSDTRDAAGEAPDDNRQEDREVAISVSYKSTLSRAPA